MSVRLQINKKLEKFVTTHKPIKVAFGGRSSGKSTALGDIAAVKMYAENADILCLREFMDSISDSVHRVIEESVTKRLCLPGWDIQEKKIIAPGGAKTRYLGANRNPDSMQSAQGYKYSWFEEAHRISQPSIDKLIPTILRRPGAECWFSANPQSSADPFSQRFIVPFKKELDRTGYYEDDMHLIVKVNWRDNPWYDDSAEMARQWDLNNRPRAEYNWIWEGEFNDSVENGLIQQEWFEACVDAHKKLGFEPEGIRVLAHDPSDVGPDAKTYVIRHGSVILAAEELHGGSAFEGMDWALNAALDKKIDLFVWDGDGMGALLRERVQKALLHKRVDYEMYRGSAGPENPNQPYAPYAGQAPGERIKKNRDVFDKRRTQQYYRLAARMYRTYEAVTKGKYHDPDTLLSFDSKINKLEALQSELCRLPLKENSNGKIQLMTKEEMRRLGIASPNLGDACKMSLLTKQTGYGPGNFIRPSYTKW